jgi:hypothetical protein
MRQTFGFLIASLLFSSADLFKKFSHKFLEDAYLLVEKARVSDENYLQA